MAKDIIVFIENCQGKVRKVSLELLSQAHIIAAESGHSVTAVLLGQQVEKYVPEIAAGGAQKIILADDERLANYATGCYTSVVTRIIREYQPEVVLLGHTAVGKDLAPRLAQRLGVGLASDCIGIEADESALLKFRRPIYAGKAFVDVTTKDRPIVVTVRPNTFSPETYDAGQPEVIHYGVEIDQADIWGVIKDLAVAVSKRPELTEANIIIAGGRGMTGPEQFKVLEELADAIGGAVGASRVAVDAGWVSHEYQVGQTGKTVSPTLYIACGISGAIQHIAGMGSSRYIVAINKDPEANIFNVADCGIVGDLFEIVPLLTQELKKVV